MLRSNVTFIVGAGASRDAGFPLGPDLKAAIQKKLHIRFEVYSQTGGDMRIGQHIMDLARKGHPKAQSLQTAALDVARKLPQVSSIDTLLSLLENPDAVTVAKMAIITAISEAENGSSLAVGERGADGGWFERNSRLWHSELFKALHEDIPRSNVENIFSRVRIITFNYDRTIEHYFFHALQNLYDIPAAEAARIVGSLDVIHPYGSLGPLPFMDQNGVAFGHMPPLNTAPQRILTFSEQIQDEGITSSINRAINSAEKIIFLGFGYLEANLAALRPSEPIDVSDISGTALGLSSSDVSAVEDVVAEWLVDQSFGGISTLESRIDLDNKVGCLEYFQTYGRFIRA